jgi:hypothetical protein
VDLGRILAVLGLRRVGLLLDPQSTIREEGDRAAIRGEAAVRVVLRPDRQLAWLAAIEGDEPEGVAVAVTLGRAGLDGHDHARSVR